MNRFLVALLVGLALLVLVSPGLIGMLGERQLERHAESEGPAADILETLSFERSWFTSQGQHRVTLDSPAATALLGYLLPDAELADTPVLVVDTRFDHGLVPLAAAERGVAALRPALASAVSTLQVESATGELHALPGHVESRLGIAGKLQFRYFLPALERRSGATGIAHDGALLGLNISADGRALDGRLHLWELQVADGSSQATVGAVSIGASGHGSEDGLLSLALTLAVDDLRQDRLQDALQHSLDLAIRLDDLQSREVRLLLYDLQRTPPAMRATVAADGLLQVLAGGATLSVSPLAIDTPQGRIDGGVDLALEAGDALRSWPSVLLRLAGSAILEVPRASVDPTLPGGEMLQQLLALGYLEPGDDERYRMQIEIDHGQARVNGAPLSLAPQSF